MIIEVVSVCILSIFLITRCIVDCQKYQMFEDSVEY